MVIGCKIGCLCSDINKEYCCKECDKNENCKNSCETIQKLLTKEVIIKNCKNSYEKID